jgi:hypothetical protein
MGYTSKIRRSQRGNNQAELDRGHVKVRSTVAPVPPFLYLRDPQLASRLAGAARNDLLVEAGILAVVLDHEDSLTPFCSFKTTFRPRACALSPKALDEGDKIGCKAFGFLPVQQISGARIDDEP